MDQFIVMNHERKQTEKTPCNHQKSNGAIKQTIIYFIDPGMDYITRQQASKDY